MLELYKKFFQDTRPNNESIVAELAQVMKRDILPERNLGTFSTTKMDKSADYVLMMSSQYNLVNRNEYSNINNLMEECIKIFATLFNAPKDMVPCGTSTAGSAEACFLAGLNFKYLWKKNNCESAYNKLNIVLGDNVHLIWYKFAKFFNIELRIIRTHENNLLINHEQLSALIDENTIGICATLGTTFTGSFDPIYEMNNILNQIHLEKQLFIPMHIDAASGGFIAPFKYPNLLWDFRLTHIISINVSSHKYGFTYPSQGWIIVKDKSLLADDLFYSVPYLAGDSKSINLNFSMSSQSILAQAYNFLKYGIKGYEEIVCSLYEVRKTIIKELEKFNFVKIQSQNFTLPIIICSVENNLENLTEQFAMEMLKLGWSIPVYSLPGSNKKVARIVIRKELDHNLRKQLIHDLNKTLSNLLRKSLIPHNPVYFDQHFFQEDQYA